MNPFAVGIDVPVSEMPAGMAFDSEPSGGYGIKDFGSDFLSGLGKGVLGALGGGSRESGYARSSTPYTDRTRDLLSVLITQAVDAFKPGRSTIS